MSEESNPTPAHYLYSYKGVKLDPYRIFKIYNVTDPGIQHAIKKLLCAGKRGEKPMVQDIQESISALQRTLEIISEDQE